MPRGATAVAGDKHRNAFEAAGPAPPGRWICSSVSRSPPIGPPAASPVTCSRSVSFAQRCTELRRYFQGWVGYFCLVPIKSFFGDLDKWVRRRIRMCIWKSWRSGRTRVANLPKLGIREHEAWTHGMSSKGPWVLSHSQAVHQALSTALLEERGLPSLLGIWETLTSRKRTA